MAAGSEGAAARLAAELGSACVGTRDAAVAGLAELGLAALPHLLPLLRPGAEGGPWQAPLGAAGLVGRLFHASELRAVQGCHVALGELADEDVSLQLSALHALAAIGPEATPAAGAVAAYLQDPAAGMRCEAAAVLGQIGAARQHTDAVAVAVAELRYPDALVQLAAARAVGCLGALAAEHRRRACGVAANSLAHEDWRVRVAAAEALKVLGEDAAPSVGSLAALLEDDNLQVQCAGAAALGCLQALAAAHAAAACGVAAWSVDNPDPELRVAAAATLGCLAGHPAAQKPAEQACAAMVREMDSPSALLRLGAIRALSALDGELVAPHLARATELAMSSLQDADHRVRVEAARAIGCLHSAVVRLSLQACEVAAGALDSADSAARAEACQTLGCFGTRAVAFAPDLAAALQDGRAEVRDAAANSLWAMGQEGLGHLARGLQDPSWRARTAAAKVLEAHGYAGAMQHTSVKAMRDA